MIERKDLDGIKLVQDENFNPQHIVEEDLNHAVYQGSQGWGVQRLIGTILTLARDLRDALDDAARAATDHGQLKGLQMENGRLKKKIGQLEAELLARDLQIKDLTIAAGSDIPSNEGVDEEG